MSIEGVPVIDLSADRGQVVAALRDAASRIGFASLVGHGVPAAVTTAAFDASRAFHGLPLERKMSVELDVRHRGYIPIDTSTDRTSSVEPATRPNRSESFMSMREDAVESVHVADGVYLAGPNQWPALDGFREAVEAYDRALVGVGSFVMSLFAEILGDEAGALRRSFDPPTTWLRLLHYPSSTAADDGAYGSAPHRDFGCITLLAQDGAGGLQVGTAGGDWVDVAPDADALVLNVGDMLHRWSNGSLISTPHRVVSRRDRFSIAFFYDPHMTTVVEPLPSCVDDAHPARFDPIQFGAFVRRQLEAGYDSHRHRQ